MGKNDEDEFFFGKKMKSGKKKGKAVKKIIHLGFGSKVRVTE